LELNLSNLPNPSNEILRLYTQSIKSKFPGIITGLFITGSIALNDFCPSKSDIDFIAISDEQLSAIHIKALSEIHVSIQRKYPTNKMDGYYLTWNELGKKSEEISNLPSIIDGKMSMKRRFPLDELYWLELEKYSIKIFGARNIQSISDSTKVIEVLANNINSYWLIWMKKHQGLLGIQPLLLLFFPRLTEWSVLGVSRQFYTLKTNKITSKTEAGKYCQYNMSLEYDWIINEAIEIRKNRRPFFRPSFKRKRETLNYLKYTIDKFNTEKHLLTKPINNTGLGF